MNIEVISFENILVDGISAGDAISVALNNLGALDSILKALIDYDESRVFRSENRLENIDHAMLLTQNQSLLLENAHLKTKLAPAIYEIAPELLESGLLRWAQDAVSAVDSELGELILGLVLQLKSVAIEQPSITQCDRIKELFGAIGQMSGVWPNSNQSKAMQEILDAGCPSTGPVKEEFLSFKPWI